MEGDKRTFSNPVTDEDYIYDAIYDAYKILKNLRFKLIENDRKEKIPRRN